jgi:DNA topoisomerase VI subunit B
MTLTMATPHKLERATFATNRMLEFCSEKELVAQTGTPVKDWPIYLLKELVDNALDACEEAGRAPEVNIEVGTGKIVIADNGPGIPVNTVRRILDFSVRVSSREAYVSPTRGAQGNALKTVLAMPFALDGSLGRIVIEAHEVAHEVQFRVDHVRQEPKLAHSCAVSPVRTGTRITVFWPDSASSNLVNARARFLQIADNFCWLNPHLALKASWDGTELVNVAATNPTWSKWLPSDPTSPHWYTPARLERLIAAYLGHDEANDRKRTVREFVSEFRGLSGSAKQKIVLANTDTSGWSLAELFGDGQIDKAAISKLLTEMQATSRPVKPKDLGVIGKAHLARMFKAASVLPESFQYKCTPLTADGLPQVVEAAFGFCPEGEERRQIVGVNWSPAIINPFRSLGPFGKSLDAILTEQRAGDRSEPIIFLLHLAHPCVEYSDRGKSSVVVDGADDIAGDDDE